VAEIVARIEGLFEGDTTWNTYFLMRPTGRADEPQDDETASVCWAGSSQKARELIEQTGDQKHRVSLLEVLEAAVALRSKLPEPPSGDALLIEARGRPPAPRKSGSVDSAEWDWRFHLAKRVKYAMLGRPPFPRTEWFSVHLDFFLSRMATDVDNLVKPVMDTLFRPGVDNPNRAHMQDITAVLFPDHEDRQVRELILRKHEMFDQGKQGIRIAVRRLSGEGRSVR
jgi:hypothetical protein